MPYGWDFFAICISELSFTNKGKLSAAPSIRRMYVRYMSKARKLIRLCDVSILQDSRLLDLKQEYIEILSVRERWTHNKIPFPSKVTAFYGLQWKVILVTSEIDFAVKGRNNIEDKSMKKSNSLRPPGWQLLVPSVTASSCCHSCPPACARVVAGMVLCMVSRMGWVEK